MPTVVKRRGHEAVTAGERAQTTCSASEGDESETGLDKKVKVKKKRKGRLANKVRRMLSRRGQMDGKKEGEDEDEDDKRKITVEDKDDSVIDLRQEDKLAKEDDANKASSAKDNLLKIVVSDRENSSEEEDKASDSEDEDLGRLGLFERGSNLVSSVRNSLRKIGFRGIRNNSTGSTKKINAKGQVKVPRLQGIEDKDEEETKKPDSKKEVGNKKAVVVRYGPDGKPLSREECNESQDSGLGEDSDFFDPSLSTCSPRSPTPGTSSSVSNSQSIPVRGLRKGSESTSSRESTSQVITPASAAQAKKHVMIREPSLTHLPSSQRRSYQAQQVQVYVTDRRLEKVHIYPKATRVPEVQTRIMKSVSGQLGLLYQSAYAEVLQCVRGCESFVVKLVFEGRENLVRTEIRQMVDVSGVVYTVYRILFYDWLGEARTGQLSMILHCVQTFLIVVFEEAEFEDHGGDKRRLVKDLKALKRSCEAMRYRHLGACLDHTRRIYIDFWSSLLSLPYVATSSPTLSDIRRSTRARLNVA